MTTLTVEVASTLTGPGTAVPYLAESADVTTESPSLASVTVAASDPIVAQLIPGAWLRFYDGADPVAACRIERVEIVEVALGEEDAQRLTASGRTLVAEWDRFVVYPAGGPGRTPYSTTRMFGAMCAEYDDSGWGEAIPGWQQGIWTPGPLVDHGPINADPVGYQDPAGWYCYGLEYSETAPAGRCYFRATFTVSATISARVQAAWDDIGEIWLDEIHLGEGKQLAEAGNYLTPVTAGIDLTPGEHLVFGWVENLPRGEFNVAGMVASIYRITSEGYGDLVWRLDDTALALQDPEVAPGVGWGLVVRVLHEEAVARGMPSWTLHFDDDVDSDGVPWTPQTIPTRIGTSLLSLLGQVAESGTYQVVAGAASRELWIHSTASSSGATWTTGDHVTGKTRITAFSPQALEPSR